VGGNKIEIIHTLLSGQPQSVQRPRTKDFIVGGGKEEGKRARWMIEQTISIFMHFLQLDDFRQMFYKSCCLLVVHFEL
jgi:hypothetical protein